MMPQPRSNQQNVLRCDDGALGMKNIDDGRVAAGVQVCCTDKEQPSVVDHDDVQSSRIVNKYVAIDARVTFALHTPKTA